MPHKKNCICATHKNRVGNDRLRLGRGGGWVVVIGTVQLSRERARRSVGGGPI